MPAPYDEVDRYIADHLEESLADLERLVRIPSVSAKGEGIAEAAELVASLLREAGFEARVMPTAGHPVVYADSAASAAPAGGEGRTLICYNHYDVQPPEPLEQWRTPPFEPTVRDGAIYARGAVDDKGQVWAHVQAIAAWHRHGDVVHDVVVFGLTRAAWERAELRRVPAEVTGTLPPAFTVA